MNSKPVKYGLNLITAGILLVIAGTYFHGQIASVAGLAPSEEAKLVFLGLFWGGVCGCIGILATVGGLLTRSSGTEPVSLLPTLVILAGAIILFLMLLYVSFLTPGSWAPKPGETITI